MCHDFINENKLDSRIRGFAECWIDAEVSHLYYVIDPKS